MTAHQAPATERLLGRARTAGQIAQRTVRRVLDENRSAAGRGSSASRLSGAARLSPAGALRQNGFTVFRGLFTTAECARFAAALKREAGIRDGVRFTKVDAANRYQQARSILFEGRILDAVSSALAATPKFLQVGDLHYLHDTAAWHRDSVHRAHDASQAPDWSDTDNPFGVVKAILYLETANAAMGIMAGSHASPIQMDHDRVNEVERAGGQLVIGPDDEPNLRLTDAQRRTPLAWQASAGDVLVFDERMYHCGRRVDGGRVTANREAPKFTLSLVFGRDNHHSERMYSYFRYARRELAYQDLPADFAAELAARDLVLSRGWTNFYLEQPQELRHVHLPDRTRMQPLIDEFSRAGG